MSEFQVLRNDFSTGRIVKTPPVESVSLEEGEVLVKIIHFAYTANNITYAVAGYTIGYWHFFPPADANPEEWGIIPVWGFAEVVRSNVPEIPIGDRLFGYFPPANYLKLLPQHISRGKLIDVSEHRSHLPMPYNIYRRVSNDPHYDPTQDYARMMLWPLHITAYSLWDSLKENNWYGAEQVLILSASSKTSIGLAIALDEDPEAPQIIGLTSPRNKEKVKAAGLYHEVHTYDDLSQIAHKKSVIVDMSGNIKAINQLDQALGENLNYCIRVGITHWEQAEERVSIPKDRREFFFAPSHIQKRIKEWGNEKFNQESTGFIMRSSARIGEWMRYEKVKGLEGLMGIHKDVCHGRVAADVGLVVEI